MRKLLVLISLLFFSPVFAQYDADYAYSYAYFNLYFEKLQVQAPSVYVGQEFWVRATFRAGSTPYNPDTFTATIELPSGFKLKEGESLSHSNPYIPPFGYWSTEWVVIAPDETGSFMINVTVNSLFPQKASVSINVTHKPVNPTISVYGTEYRSGETATIYAQIKDEDGTPINLADCSISIYFPNRTVWKEYEPLIYLPGSFGLYYYNFIAPNVEGVYSVSVNCSNPTVYGSSTFHVAPWASEITEIKEKVEEVKTVIDDIADKVEKIPLISDTVFSISNSLTRLGVSFNFAFLISILILTAVGFSSILCTLYIIYYFKGEKKEEEEIIF